MSDLVVVEYGGGPGVIITLHGGPAAAGDVAPLARELGKRWRVLEPHQRGSSGQALSVATHVEDLHDLVEERARDVHPILVGHSWGAMLALAYAASHPARTAGLVLIGCGTFSTLSRREFERRLDAKLTPSDRADIARLERDEPDGNRQLAMVGRLMTRVSDYDVEDGAVNVDVLDAQAYKQTWADMVTLRRDGVYPAAFAAIDVPVLMLHGDVDPHPGLLIAEDLREYIPHLEYVEFAECGHSPWLERRGRTAFFSSLNAWIRALAPLSPGRPAQLRLIELREKARQALGERFSLKGFHNAVLTAGTLPIDMLEREVDTYIQSAARR